MKKNVLDFEPELALFVDDDNALKYYDSILKFGIRYMKKMGYLFFEINENLCSQLQNIIVKNNYSYSKAFNDCNNKTRFLLIKNRKC